MEYNFGLQSSHLGTPGGTFEKWARSRLSLTLRPGHSWSLRLADPQGSGAGLEYLAGLGHHSASGPVAQNCSRGVAGPGGHQQEEQVYHSLRPGSFIPDLLQGRKARSHHARHPPSPTQPHSLACSASCHPRGCGMKVPGRRQTGGKSRMTVLAPSSVTHNSARPHHKGLHS